MGTVHDPNVIGIIILQDSSLRRLAVSEAFLNDDCVHGTNATRVGAASSSICSTFALYESDENPISVSFERLLSAREESTWKESYTWSTPHAL